MEGTLTLDGRCAAALEWIEETLKCDTTDAMRTALIYTYLTAMRDAQERKRLKLTLRLCKASDEIDAEEEENGSD